MYLSNITALTSVQTLLVPNIGQISAGASVDYLPSVVRVRITVPANARAGDRLIVAEACGDSLRDDGIFNGDRIVCRTNFEQSEIRNGRLVIVSLPCGGLVLKHFHLVKRSRRLMICLRSANPAYEDKYFELGAIQVKAVVLESIRTWT